MFAIRLISLLFIVFLGSAMASLDQRNTFGEIMYGSLIIAIPVLYFLPTIEAIIKDNKDLYLIIIINIFLGWTLVGWVVALAWNFKGANVSDNIKESTIVNSKASVKICPYCAEEILVGAIKCKHCLSAV